MLTPSLSMLTTTKATPSSSFSAPASHSWPSIASLVVPPCHRRRFRCMASSSSSTPENDDRPPLPLRLPGLSAVADSFDLLLLDQFGVIHDGKRPYDGVESCLGELRKREKVGSPQLIHFSVHNLFEPQTCLILFFLSLSMSSSPLFQRVFLLSNSSRLSDSTRERLLGMGLDASSLFDEIITGGECFQWAIKEAEREVSCECY